VGNLSVSGNAAKRIVSSTGAAEGFRGFSSKSNARKFERLAKQRSHVLVVQSGPVDGQVQTFLDWYLGRYLAIVEGVPACLEARHYRRHPVDITQGQCRPLPYDFLGLYQLSIDGAEEAESIIALIHAAHESEETAHGVATWLYHPVSERVGSSPADQPSTLTIAFANPVEGRETEFVEWYATRHVRHALCHPMLLSGQCFARSHAQHPGALDASYRMIAIYEQEGAPEEFVAAGQAVPAERFDFPAMRWDRSTMACYEPLGQSHAKR